MRDCRESGWRSLGNTVMTATPEPRPGNTAAGSDESNRGTATTTGEPSYDPVAAPGHSDLQFSLREIMAVTLGVVVGVSAYRWLPGKIVPLLFGVSVIVGWLKLYVDDWEPRWFLVIWIALVGGYLGVLLASLSA